RRPGENVVVTSSKRTFDPKRIDTALTEIIGKYLKRTICLAEESFHRSRQGPGSGLWSLVSGRKDHETSSELPTTTDSPNYRRQSVSGRRSRCRCPSRTAA